MKASRLRRPLCCLILLAGLRLVYLGWYPQVPVSYPLALLGRHNFLVVGCGLSVLALAGRWVATRWLLAAASASVAAATGLWLAAQMADQWLWIAIAHDAPQDFVLPYPGSTVIHRHRPDFEVAYQFGPDSWRITPDPVAPLGEVLVLGCSYTLGYGVPDWASYPFRLGRDHWPRYKVANRGYEYAGTILAQRLLSERLQKSPPPAAVLYGWIWDHQNRNLRLAEGADWTAVARFDLELEPASDEFQFRGQLRKPAESVAPHAAYRLAEVLSAGLIDQMHRQCQAAGVPFVVCAFRMRSPHPPDRVIEILARRKIPLIDLTDLGGFYPHDGHPLPQWHRQVAQRLAASPELAFLRAATAAGAAQSGSK